MAPATAILSNLATRTTELYRRVTQNPNYHPGQGTFGPADISNTTIFIIFGLLGAGFALVGIWFGFWAKNGGFRFRKNDWEDYKSTVLRRKGPNGTTLSGGTRSTVLGGGSIVGSYSDYKPGDLESQTGTDTTTTEKRKKRVKRLKEKKRDHKTEEETIQEYDEEKPAQVGGLNRAADGEYSVGNAPSETASYHPQMSDLPKIPKMRQSDLPKGRNLTGDRRSPQRRDFSYAPASESSFTVSNISDNSSRPLRHAGKAMGHSSPPKHKIRQVQPSTHKPHRSRHREHHDLGSQSGSERYTERSYGRDSGYAEPMDFSRRVSGQPARKPKETTEGLVGAKKLPRTVR